MSLAVFIMSCNLFSVTLLTLLVSHHIIIGKTTVYIIKPQHVYMCDGYCSLFLYVWDTMVLPTFVDNHVTNKVHIQ